MRIGALTLTALSALAFAGCETTAEKSARLERQAKLHPVTFSTQGLTIAHSSTHAKVLSSTVLRGSEGAAVVVMLRNTSARPLGAVPIAITVRDSHGTTLYQNNAPGLQVTLVSVASIPAHATVTWVDDQVPANGAPASASAQLGEAPAVPGVLPALSISGVQQIEDPTNGLGATGTVSNQSRLTQSEVPVYCVALRAGRVVAAGKARVRELSPGASAAFQLFFVGDPRGAKLQASALPTVLH